MTPNQITVFRVFLALLAIGLFEISPATRFLAVGLTVIAVALDAVDGYVARKRHLESALGATVDILGDRMVENIYLIYFASAGMISFWIPIAFIVRGMATDFVRALASSRGKCGFGKNGMLETWWGKALVGSRFSRGFYGVVKCAAFCVLGLLLSVGAPPTDVNGHLGAVALPVLKYSGLGLVYLVLSLCLVRALPVLWEGRRFLRLDEKSVTAL